MASQQPSGAAERHGSGTTACSGGAGCLPARSWQHHIWPPENLKSKPALEAVIPLRVILARLDALTCYQILTDQSPVASGDPALDFPSVADFSNGKLSLSDTVVENVPTLAV